MNTVCFLLQNVTEATLHHFLFDIEKLNDTSMKKETRYNSDRNLDLEGFWIRVNLVLAS